MPTATNITAAGIFGPDWRSAKKVDLDKHFRHHHLSRDHAALIRALNALTRHYGSYFQTSRRITLGELADLAADEQSDRINIGYYGPAAREAAARFFGDADPRFQANDPLPTRLSLGDYQPSPDFLQFNEHIALLDDQQRLIALVGPSQDTSSGATARLLAAAPQLLEAARLAHYWLTARSGQSPSPAAVETIRAAVAQAMGDHGWNGVPATEHPAQTD